MEIIGSVYDYKNKNLGDCILLQYTQSSTHDKSFYNLIYPKLTENELKQVCSSSFLFNRKLSDHLAYSDFKDRNSNELWVNSVYSNQQKKGLGTDLLKGISMFANTTNQDILSLSAFNHAVGFYEKLGFMATGYKGKDTSDMTTKISQSKFADFSQFKRNPIYSEIVAEVFSK